MARLGARVQRLTKALQGRHKDPFSARIARMSYEELEAEAVEHAVRMGFPAEQARADPEAARRWASAKTRAHVAGLPEDEREEFMAQNPHLRDPWP